MSSDQQYPYGQQYGYGEAEPRQGPAPAGEGPPREGEAYGQQQPYGDPVPYDAAPYDAAPYNPAAYEPAPYDPASGAYAHEPQQPQQPQQPVMQAPVPIPSDDGATQTWQGQTWDTQYQPTIQPAHGQPAHGQPAHGQQAHGQPGPPVRTPVPGYPEAGDTTHLRPLGTSSGYPLPPEVTTAPAPAAAPAPAPAADAAGYSPPTVVGNSRITDAQRARAEGRSPVIAPGMQPAAITAGLGLLLALGAAVGPYALLVPLVLLQAVTAAGWFRLNGMWPARQGIALAFVGGFVADAVLLAAGREHAAAAIVGTLGVWVLLTLVLQLRSHAGADERMQGLMATVASAALAVLAAGHLAAIPEAVTVGGAAVAAAVVARALPLPGVASVAVALLGAAGAGLAVGVFTDFGARSAFLGIAAGGCALIGLRVASYDYPSRFVHMTAGVALPLTAAAPAVYLIGRAIA